MVVVVVVVVVVVRDGVLIEKTGWLSFIFVSQKVSL